MKLLKLLFFLLLSIPASAQTQLGTDIDGSGVGDRCGWSVEVSDDGQKVVVGSPRNNPNFLGLYGKGQARVFEYVNNSWIQLGNSIDGIKDEQALGFSVGISGNGNKIAVGSIGDNGMGSTGLVTVYKDSSGFWIKQGNSLGGDNIGWALDLSDDGTTLAVSSGIGLVRVFKWVNSSWTQIGYDITGIPGTGWGIELSYNGEVLAVGTESDTGYVKTYSLLNDTIVPLANTIYQNTTNGGYGFAYSISLADAGNRLAVGDFAAGYVSVYELNNNVWVKIGSDIVPSYYSVDFGFSISLSSFGGTLAIGSRQTSGNGLGSGRTEVYEWSYQSNDWILISYINGEISQDQSGYSVSLSDSGSVVAIGAPYHIPGGQVRIYDLGTLEVTEKPMYNLIFRPNPTSGILNIVVNSLSEYEVFNINGQRVAQGKTEGQIDITNLPTGSYQIIITNDDGRSTHTIQKI